MATLYLDRNGAALDAEAGSLVVRFGGAVATRIPLAPLERVVVHGEAVLSARLLAALWRHDVGLLLLSGRHSEATARLVGRPHDDAALRLLQYRRAVDAEACRAAGRRIVAAKLAGAARLLGRALALRPDRRKPLGDAAATLARLEARIAGPGEGGEALDRDALMGIEGAGAAAFFRAYATLFPESLGFAQRRRRPPPDPVNVALSLGYTLLHHLAVREAQIIGLDPLIGFLHVPERGRESLACDLVEPLRPHVEEWVWRAFAERRLRAEHFSRERGGGCLLGKAGRQAFYDGFEPTAAALRRLLRRICRDLAAELRREPAPAPGSALRAARGQAPAGGAPP